LLPLEIVGLGEEYCKEKNKLREEKR